MRQSPLSEKSKISNFEFSLSTKTFCIHLCYRTRLGQQKLQAEQKRKIAVFFLFFKLRRLNFKGSQKKKVDWLFDLCFTPPSTILQSYGYSSHYSCHSWASPVLGWGSEVSCPNTLVAPHLTKEGAFPFLSFYCKGVFWFVRHTFTLFLSTKARHLLC